MNSKKQHCEVTDLVSAGVEEVPQTDDVAVVQLSHDLQLTVLQNTKEKERQLTQCVDVTTEELLVVQSICWTVYVHMRGGSEVASQDSVAHSLCDSVDCEVTRGSCQKQKL